MIDNQHNPSIQIIRQRVQTLYQRGGQLTQQNELLAAAFEELEFALEQLQAAEAQQRRQQEQWLNSRAELETETKNYQDLFVQAPAGYLVTSLEGTIRRSNITAAKLLQSSERSLVGRSLALFVPEGQRRAFRAHIAHAAAADGVQEWELSMQGWEGGQFAAGLTVVAVRGKLGKRPTALHWLLRDVSARNGIQPTMDPSACSTDGAPAELKAQDKAAAREDQEAELARARFTFLTKTSALMTVAQDVDSMLGHIAHLAVPALADGCVVDLADPHTGMVQQLVVVRESSAEYFVRTWRRSYAPKQGAARPVAKAAMLSGAATSRLAAQTENGPADLRTMLSAVKPASAIVAPLRIDDRVLGSVTFISGSAERQYNAVDVALVDELARQIALTVERIRR